MNDQPLAWMKKTFWDEAGQKTITTGWEVGIYNPALDLIIELGRAYARGDISKNDLKELVGMATEAATKQYQDAKVVEPVKPVPAIEAVTPVDKPIPETPEQVDLQYTEQQIYKMMSAADLVDDHTQKKELRRQLRKMWKIDDSALDQRLKTLDVDTLAQLIGTQPIQLVAGTKTAIKAAEGKSITE